MIIPKILKVGMHEITIKELAREHKSDLWGQVSSTTSVISLNPDLCQSRKEEVLFHELVHLILNNYNYSDEASNEQLVTVISNGIYQVLTENGLLKEE